MFAVSFFGFYKAISLLSIYSEFMCIRMWALTLINSEAFRLAQLLNARYRCGSSGVRFPGRSNRHSVFTAATFRRSYVALALSHGEGAPQIVVCFGVIPRVQ